MAGALCKNLQPDIKNICFNEIRNDMQISGGIKILPYTYNGFKPKNMMAVRILYDYKTGNTAMNLKQLENLNRLYDIKQLDANWNGYEGQQISRTAIDMAENIIKNVCIQPLIFPTGRNSIQMQYELADRSYLEFEIFEEKIVCMKVPKRVYERASFEVFVDVDMERLNKIIEEFYGQ